MVHHLNKPLSLPTQNALNDVVIQSELLQAKTIEFTCADDERVLNRSGSMSLKTS